MAPPVDIEWSQDALDDLDRFSQFLQREHPDLAHIVAQEIVAKAQALSAFPQMGRPLEGREEYR